MFFAVVLYALFGIGAAAAVAGLAFGIVKKFRDKRTPQQRWADEHGDRDTLKITPGAQTMWFGTGK